VSGSTSGEIVGNADHQSSFETVFARSTAGFFLREFCFSSAKFVPPNRSEVELADFVIQLDDLLMIFQVKARDGATADPERERSWFRDKVVKTATRQVRDTVTYAHFPDPPFSDDEKKLIAANVYAHVWQQAVSDGFGVGA
jgi:hypothetical protein